MKKEQGAGAKEVRLVDEKGTMTVEGLKLFMDKTLTEPQREVLREQALRQEVFGVQD